MASTLDLETLVGLILDQLQALVDYSAVAVFMAEGDYLRVLDYRWPLSRERMRGLKFPVADAPVTVKSTPGRGTCVHAEVALRLT